MQDDNEQMIDESKNEIDLIQNQSLEIYKRDLPIDIKFIRKFRNTQPKKTIDHPNELPMELLNQILMINPYAMALSLSNKL